MALFAANAVTRSGPRFDIRAQKSALHSPRLSKGGLLLSPFNFIRSIAQGACAGLLTLLGAMHVVNGTSGAEASSEFSLLADPGSFEALTQGLFAGRAPGVVEIIGAGALFLSAGRGVGRIIGLLGFIVAAMAHANGADHSDFVPFLANIYEQIQILVQQLSGGAR